MSGSPVRDRRSERRQATIAEIIAAAWILVRAEGLAGLSLRELAARVGMRPQSLYTYFSSKNAIYDAMFIQGATDFVAGQAVVLQTRTARAFLTAQLAYFIEFCAVDPARYQLLFQRTIPGFEPSPEAFAISQQALAAIGDHLSALGITHPRALDLLTAVGTGMADQQVSNDPGGDRWLALADDAVDMFLDFVTKPTTGKEVDHGHDHH